MSQTYEDMDDKIRQKLVDARLDLTLPHFHRKCYTMADAIAGKKDASDANGQFYNVVERSRNNLFLSAMRQSNHALLKSDAGAIGELSNIVVKAATPDAIGRSLVRRVDTQKTSVKFRKPALGLATESASGPLQTDSYGEENTFTTINTNIELEASQEWNQTFLEDAEWDILSSEAEAIGVALKIKESNRIIAMLTDLTEASLATGDDVDTANSGKVVYEDVVDAWTKVKSENRNPNVLALHPDEFGDLWKDTKFLDNMMFGDFVDKSTGSFGRSILGFQVLVSSLIPAGFAYMIDTTYAIGMPVRRDMVVRPYDPSDGRNSIAGVQATSRFGLGILDSKCVSRIDVA